MIGISQAQNYDVACDTIFLPAPNSNWTSGTIPLRYVRSNVGDPLAAADTVRMHVYVDGNRIGAVNRGAAPFATGAKDTAGINLTLNNIAIGQHEVCVAASIVGKTDSDNTNDTSCSKFNIIGPDLGVDSVVVQTPAKNPGDTFELGDVITSMYISAKNYNSSLFAQSGIPITLKIGDSLRTLNGPLRNALAPNGTNGDKAGWGVPAALIPPMPTTVGAFKVCAYTTIAGDTDNSNDTTCHTFYMKAATVKPLAITSFTPASGPVGTVVTITGTGFDATASNNTVKFNGTTATVSSATKTQLMVSVPTGATTGKITVEVAGKSATSANDYTVTTPVPTLAITSFTPGTGQIGDKVTITGTGFSPTASNNNVTFNGTPAIVTSSTATEIVTTVPTGATTGKIGVVVSGNSALSSSDFVVKPSSVALFDELVSKYYYAKNNLYVTFGSNVDKATLKVIDMTGKTVVTKSFDSVDAGSEVSMDVSELNSGVYFLSTGSATHKFVK